MNITKEISLKEARYYERLTENRVRCTLCSHLCLIRDGKAGICMIRENKGGTLYATGYGRCTSLCMDPIEKKPLYHFYPGSSILSTGPNACNFSCKFCQNWYISQEKAETEFILPEKLVEIALSNNSIGIAYTYTEPLVWFEYLMDVCKIAKDRGIKNVLVTNGDINQEPLSLLLPYIDAANIDLKSMSEVFYRRICGGKLETTLNTIQTAIKHIHVELTNLLIPTLNDSEEDVKRLIDWIYNLNEGIPLHFSRYFPHYKMDLPPTPLESILRAYEIAKKKLKYVYVGNINIKGASDTYCPSCNRIWISRNWHHARILGLKNGNCINCGMNSKILGA